MRSMNAKRVSATNILVPEELDRELWSKGTFKMDEIIKQVNSMLQSSSTRAEIEQYLATLGWSGPMSAWIVDQVVVHGSGVRFFSRSQTLPIAEPPRPVDLSANISLLAGWCLIVVWVIWNRSSIVPNWDFLVEGGTISDIFKFILGLSGFIIVAKSRRQPPFIWGTLGVLLLGPALAAGCVTLLTKPLGRPENG